MGQCSRVGYLTNHGGIAEIAEYPVIMRLENGFAGHRAKDPSPSARVSSSVLNRACSVLAPQPRMKAASMALRRASGLSEICM